MKYLIKHVNAKIPYYYAFYIKSLEQKAESLDHKESRSKDISFWAQPQISLKSTNALGNRISQLMVHIILTCCIKFTEREEKIFNNL